MVSTFASIAVTALDEPPPEILMRIFLWFCSNLSAKIFKTFETVVEPVTLILCVLIFEDCLIVDDDVDDDKVLPCASQKPFSANAEVIATINNNTI